MKVLDVWKLIAIVLLGNIVSLAQAIPVEQGFKPFGSFHGSDIDQVSLRDGNLSLRIPLVSWPQRGGLHLGFFIGFNDASIAVGNDARTSPCDKGCDKDLATGVADGVVVFPDFLPSVQFSGPFKTTSGEFSGQPAGIYDGMGTMHSFFNLFNAESGANNPQPPANTPVPALDGSGYTMTLFAGSCPNISNYVSTAVQDRHGVRYTYPTSCLNPLNVNIEDPNGNQINVSNIVLGSLFNVVIPNDPAPGTPTITDSMGRSIIAPPGPNQGSALGFTPSGSGAPIAPAAFATPGPSTSTSGCTGSPAATSAQLWTVPGPPGGPETFKFCFTQIYINISAYSGCTFQSTGVANQNCFVNYGPYSRLSSIVLPDGSAWGFVYDSAPANSSSAPGAPLQIGDLLAITLPTGGTISYTWGGWQGTDPAHRKGGVITRTVNANDGTGLHKWTYNGVGTQTQNANGTLNTQVVATVTDPLNNQSVHTLTDPTGTLSLYETLTQYEDPSGNILETVQTTYSGATTTPSGISPGGAMNVFPQSVTTTLANGLVSTIQKDYDFNPPGSQGGVSFGTVTAERDYDYAKGSPGPLLRQTVNSYVWQSQALSNSSSPCPYTTQTNSKASAYQANNIIDAPILTQIYNGNCNLAAQTAYGYDETALVPSGIPTQHDPSPPAGSARGNQTSLQRWLNTSGAFLSTTKSFYDTGMVSEVTDPLLNSTTHTYDSVYAGAYSTKTCSPATNGGATTHCVSGTYDFNTGVLTSFTNENASTQANGNTPGDAGHTSNYTYDFMWRLTQVQAPPDPSNGNARATTTLTYSQPNVFPLTVLRTNSITTGMNDSATTVFDGLGRPTQTQHAVPGGTALVDTVYDLVGRVALVSNPYFSPSDPTYGLTRTFYDALGRPTQVTKQDGSVSSVAYDLALPSAPGDCTQTTDEANKLRLTCSDALGRLIRVWEDPNGLNYETDYQYDALGNLLRVDQKGSAPSDSSQWHSRLFTYNSLSQLLTAQNPESGLISYAYDPAGNVLQKTSPQANQTGSATTTVTYCYDKLNRIAAKAYTNSPATPPTCATLPPYLLNPAATYTYDVGTNGIGHLTSLTDQAGSAAYGYDPLGRVASEQRTIAGVSKSMSYKYYLDNSLETLTYPSNAVITYTSDSAGRVLSAVDGPNNINYVTEATYGADNSLIGFTNGQTNNFSGISNGFSFNNRLQPVNMLASAPGSTGTDATASVTIGGSLQTAPQAAAAGSPMTTVTSGGVTTTHVLMPGGHLYGLYCSGNPMTCSGQDETAAGGNITPASGSPLVTALNSQTPYTYFFGAGGIIDNWCTTSGCTWDNPSGDTAQGPNGQAPAIAAGSPLNVVATANGLIAYYLSTSHHVISLNTSLGFSNTWLDVTAAGGSITPDAGSPMVTVLNGQTPYTYFFGGGGHIILNVCPTSGCTWDDPFGDTAQGPNGQAPAIASGSPLNVVAAANGLIAYYLSTSGHVIALNTSLGFSDNWQDLTASAADSGTVSLSVGGFTATACFGLSISSACSGQPVNSSPNQVASALAAALNTSASPVAATISGATINLTWKAPGPFTPSVSGLNTTHDNASLFPNPSFTSTATNFSGGSGANVLSLNYDFHLGAGDNGNVFGIANNKDATRNQTFAYDALNRLISAQNAGTGGSNQCSVPTLNGKTKFWGNSYGYDAWGNLLQKIVTQCNAEHLNVSALANNQLVGYGYDAAGNMTLDPTDSVTATYDPENRIATGTNTLTGMTMSYAYDTDGNRVEKANGSTGTLYWYMLPGIVAESDLSGNLQSEYVFFDGERVARKDFPSGAVSYYFSDHLKTTDIVTGAQGNIQNESDFYPWGGELQFTANDSNHYKFTGKERDIETGLDYFGARYYSNGLGRFITPDPLMASARVWDPQTWNRYAYARNNPLRFFDPTGLEELTASQCAKDKKCVTVKVNVIYDKKANDGDGLTDKQKAAFDKQLQEAKDEYGEAHIHLDVTYGTDYVKGAENVVVSDNAGGAPGYSTVTDKGYAVTRIDMTQADKETFAHELAHQFLGDTTGIANAIAKHDPTGLFGAVANTVADVNNDIARGDLKHVRPDQRVPGNLTNHVHENETRNFREGAARFQKLLDQKAIQPQTK